MTATDELRKWAHGPDEGDDWLDRIDEFCDRIDAEHDREMIEIRTRGWSNGYDEGFASADDWLAQHEDAMAEHGWIRLPLDADGVPICIGDWITGEWDAKAKVEAVTSDDVYWWEPDGCHWCHAFEVRHYHAPTVEDVLREFADEVKRCCDTQDTIAEYAAKLQLAEEVGA